jgi:hypothetical protein
MTLESSIISVLNLVWLKNSGTLTVIIFEQSTVIFDSDVNADDLAILWVNADE